MTIAELKEAMLGLPDHLPVKVHVELECDGDLAEVDEWVPAHAAFYGREPETTENALVISL